MVRLQRKPAQKVAINSIGMRTSLVAKKDKELHAREQFITKQFTELQRAESLIRQIQAEMQTREHAVVEKEKQVKSMAGVWKDLNNVSLHDVDVTELHKIAQNQKGFISDLLVHYTESTGRERKLLEKMKVLEGRNDELERELEQALEEIERL